MYLINQGKEDVNILNDIQPAAGNTVPFFPSSMITCVNSMKFTTAVKKVCECKLLFCSYLEPG